MTDHYDKGREAARAWMTSPQFAAFDRAAPARDAARLFLPPVAESMVQIASPLPTALRDWMRGFDDGRSQLRGEI